MSLRFCAKKGSEVADILEELASLRIVVFRVFPYLYDGSLEYEKVYLQTYINAERSFVFCVYDDTTLVGATTCIPLTDETPEVKEPFIEAHESIERIFYFGESILLPAYRGLGLGHRFFDEREAHARSFGTFQTTCFCAVERPNNHLLKPADYEPLNAFWKKRGYVQQTHLQSKFEWQDIGEDVPTFKTMNYWSREIG